MELLDDTLEVGQDLSTDNIKEVFKLRQEHSKAEKAINNARTALGIICIFSIVSLFSIVRATNDPLIIGITVGLLIIYGICAAAPPQYAKISLSIAFGLYLLNLLASFLDNPLLAIFGLIIKGFFIYFIYVGMIAAYKYTDILKKMERLNITPYKN